MDLNFDWILLDTETTGRFQPIFVVDIAAQRMQGWEALGDPFRAILNHGVNIPPEASRVHGYTREVLERDGVDPIEAYGDFEKYVGQRALSSYHLAYDLDGVLLPEWKRLGIATIGTRGVCMLQLAQRLLDPFPAGNCKLQTLRQYYRLPERGVHTALGDVQTVVDLLGSVLRPLAKARGIATWAEVCEFAGSEWYPSRLTFGKYKGRLIQEAAKDDEMRSWLHWLADSENPKTAAMGRWYLSRLSVSNQSTRIFAVDQDTEEEPGLDKNNASGIVVYVNPTVEKLSKMIAMARSRLAEIEADLTNARHEVGVTQARLFNLLRDRFQARDRLALKVKYRKTFLESLLRGGEEVAQEEARQYQEAQHQSDLDYEEIEQSNKGRKSLSPDEEREVKLLWKKLVQMHHPDRFATDPDRMELCRLLTSEINQARDRGDIERLREIASNPDGFFAQEGTESMDTGNSTEVESLEKLLNSLESRIAEAIQAMDDLRESDEYELHQLSQKQPSLLDAVARDQSEVLDQEIAELSAEADELEREITNLTGQGSGVE